MQNPWLHAALHAFVADAGALLRSDVEEGADLPFEVSEEGAGGGPVLYRYEPCTGAFIDARWSRVRELDTYEPAAEGLGGRAGAYLRHRALEGSEPDTALRDLVHRAYRDVTSFRCPEDRFERLFAEVDATVEQSTLAATIVAPLHGVRISRPRVALGDGLSLVRRAALASPPGERDGLTGTDREPAAHGAAEQAGAGALDVFCELVRELPVEADLPIDEARVIFRRALTALRLSGAGGTALGALAWGRAGDGAWQPVALGASPRARPDTWELRQGDESEVRELLGILALSRHGRGVSWALDRFEMGCERGLELEALSDHVLALRALLADPGAANGGLALRLATLCAPEPERDALAGRVDEALALERELSLGMAGRTSPRPLVREIEHHLRSLLRDVLCGYLEEDLRAAADTILMGEAPIPADDRDTQEFDAIDLADAVDQADAVDPPDAFDPAALKVSDVRSPERRPEVGRSESPAADPLIEAGVTPSDDWAPEAADPADWESYAAPV